MVTTGLEVEKLVYGGDGLSRHTGQVVLTPFVLAGEKVEVELEETRQGVARGRLMRILKPSPERIAPACPHFGSCGGCHYQHGGYAAQLQAKREILRETLERLGKRKHIPEIETVSAEPWGYRNRVQIHFQDRRMGFRQRASSRLREIESCPISSPKINQTLEILLGMSREKRWPGFIRSVELFTDETQIQINVRADQPLAKRFFDWCAGGIPGMVPGALEYGRYRVSHGSFFQVNRFLVDAMVETALRGLSGGKALDLYAGVGLFSLPLAERFEDVEAVESGTSAIRDLEFSAARAGLNIRARASTVEDYIRERSGAVDLVLADPPRTGLAKSVAARLNEMRAPAIVMISCDPATLARDLAGLPDYEIETLCLIDLFPQTFHLEALARLRLRG